MKGKAELETNGIKLSLKAARVNAGYSQEEAAKILHTSTSSISRWEMDITPIPKNILDKMCRLYGVKIAEKEN